MKRLLIFLLLSVAYPLYAQVDTKGTDFWVSFGNNASGTVTALTLQIRIVADQAASGTITFTGISGPASVVPFTVAANGVFTHTLSTAEKTASYNLNAGIFNTSVRIQSNVPVTVYALNTYAYLADATNLLPAPVLGTDYYHLGRLGTVNNRFDQYIVIATENGTIVYENGTPVATLSAGQVFFQQADMTDISGYHITSNNPIAYFSAHNYCNINGGGDNFFQQFTPVNLWGKNFMVPVTNRTIELIRIIASQNNTVITQVGGTIQPVAGGQNTLTLNAGQWVELQITLANNGCFIQADKPVQVCSYMVGSSYLGAVAPVPNGADESLALIPAIEQSIKSALISPFAVNALNYHFALVVTPTATKNNTTMKEGAKLAQPLSGGTWYDNPSAGMSFYNVQLTNDTASYVFENQNGLIVYGYGFGYSISYYYLAASSLRNLDASFYVNDVHNQDLEFEVICTQPMVFRAEVYGDMSTNPGFLKWYIDNVEVLAYRDTLIWSQSMPSGTYQIRMEVLMDDDVTIKTVEGTLTVASLTAPPITPSGVVSVCPPDTYLKLSTVGDSCRWFKDGTPIIGETDSIYYATVSGEYSVMVLYPDCSTDISDTVTVLIGGFLQAYKDSVQTISSIPVKISPLDNDSLACCGLSGITGPFIVVGENGKHGTATALNDSLIYTPDPGYLGMDSLTYYIKCGADSSAAKVFIRVIEAPDNIVDAGCFDDPIASEWQINTPILSSATVGTYYPIVVGDLNGSGTSEIVTFADQLGTLRIANTFMIFSSNATLLRQISLPGSIGVSCDGTGVIGLVKIPSPDGIEPERTLIIVAASDLYLYAYAVEKGMDITTMPTTPYWISSHPYWSSRWVNIGFTDFNHDGVPEIHVGRSIFNAATGKLLATATGGTSAAEAPIHVSSAALHQMAADVLETGTPQIVLGNEIYEVNIVDTTGNNNSANSYERVRWATDDNGGVATLDGHVCIADFDHDGHLDILVTNKNGVNVRMYLWNPKKKTVSPAITFTGGGSTYKNIPMLGDIDGDGSIEVVLLTGPTALVALKYDPSVSNTSPLYPFKQFWSYPINDSSGSTGLTMFDFNQDGIAELVYRDEANLRIINGSGKSHRTKNDTLTVSGDPIVYDLAFFVCGSATGTEYPIIADIDNDGMAEIVITGGNAASAMSGQLRIFKGNNWAPTRRVWNQYSYNAVNVKEDLTVPLYEMNPATFFPNGQQPFNNFLQQQTMLDTIGNPLWLLPDVTPVEATSSAELDGDSILFTLTITNIGDAAIGSPIYYSLYKESIPAGYIMNDSVQVQLNADSTTTFTFKVAISSIQPAFLLLVRINDKNGQFPFQPECEDKNNVIEFINPALHQLMLKDATLLPSFSHNGTLSNPVSVLFSEDIEYTITAVNANVNNGTTVVIRDTLPAYLTYLSSTPTVTPTYTGPTSRAALEWSISGLLSMATTSVKVTATPQSGVLAWSQALFANRAWVTVSDTIVVPTNYTWHQGAGVSQLTFSAGLGGNIYNAMEQVLDYRTTPHAGVVIVPDEGYRFAGWSHADYLSLRGETIPAQNGIMRYDTLTVYGDVELYADFELEQYPITCHLNGGHFPSVVARNEAICSQFSIESPSITLDVPQKEGDVFTGWTGSNGDEPQLTVTIPTGSTGERVYYANYLYSGREEIGIQLQLTRSDDLVWAVKNELFVRTSKPGSILRIYSLDGVLQQQQTILQPGETKYKLPAGLYVITLNNAIGQKVIINP